MRVLADRGGFLGLAAPPRPSAWSPTPRAARSPLPDRVERVFAAGPPASVLVYVLAPEKLAGWSRAATPAERAYLRPLCATCPSSAG